MWLQAAQHNVTDRRLYIPDPSTHRFGTKYSGKDTLKCGTIRGH